LNVASLGGRRWVLNSALAVTVLSCSGTQALAQPTTAAARTNDAREAEARRSPARMALLNQAEAALEHGDAQAAVAPLEAAAMLLHAGDTEMTQVRALMRAGQYRQALAFAAHAAGGHDDEPAASGLYAWLLQAGGQRLAAQQVIDSALERAPADKVLALTRLELATGAPQARDALLDLPHRMAPHASGNAPDMAGLDAARRVGTAVLFNAGRSVLAPAGPLAGRRQIWLRNGVGQTARAHVVKPLDALGLVVLELATPLPADPGFEAAQRDPFAGSPGYVVDYAEGADALPQWPWLHPGFMGGMRANASAPRLGINGSAGAQGGAVFDAAGRFTGIALGGADAPWVTLAALRAAAPDVAMLLPVGRHDGARVWVDEVYERALRSLMPALADANSWVLSLRCFM